MKRTLKQWSEIAEMLNSKRKYKGKYFPQKLEQFCGTSIDTKNFPQVRFHEDWFMEGETKHSEPSEYGQSFIISSDDIKLDPLGILPSKNRVDIDACCNSLRTVLLEKNRRYGDSALSPVRAFSKADADAGILIRLDDKISRIMNSIEIRKNDIFDLIGYLVLYCVSQGWTDFTDMLD